jgi:hypothetical protein
MAYRVVAPLVVAKDRKGRLHHKYEGETIEWLSDEQREHFISMDLVERTAVPELADDLPIMGTRTVDELADDEQSLGRQMLTDEAKGCADGPA